MKRQQLFTTIATVAVPKPLSRKRLISCGETEVVTAHSIRPASADKLNKIPSAKMAHKVRQMELKDLAPCFNLGSALFTSQIAATLYRTWDEFEISESFYNMPELCLVAESRVLQASVLL